MGRRLELWGRGIHDIIQCLAAVSAGLASELRPDPAMSENLTRALLQFLAPISPGWWSLLGQRRDCTIRHGHLQTIQPTCIFCRGWPLSAACPLHGGNEGKCRYIVFRSDLPVRSADRKFRPSSALEASACVCGAYLPHPPLSEKNTTIVCAKAASRRIDR